MRTTTDRVLDVLSLFVGEQGEWTVEQAAAAIGLPASTVYRYFKSLNRAGLIGSYVPGRYVLGPAIVEMDRRMRLSDPLIEAANGEMEALAKRLGGTCVLLLARLYHHGVMCVHQVSAERPPFASSYERGRLMPLFRGAASKAILANLATRDFRAAMNELDDDQNADELRKEMRRIKAAGYCVTVGELDVGLCGIAVPVFRQDQIIDGSLSAVIVEGSADLNALVDELTIARKAIEASMAIRLRRSSAMD